MPYNGLILTGNVVTKLAAIADKLNQKNSTFQKVEIKPGQPSSKKTLEQMVAKGITPVIVAAPDLIEELTKAAEFLTFLVESLKENEYGTGKEARQREYSSLCTYTIVSKDDDKAADLISELWEHRQSGGVLSQKLIKLMIECGMLLENAETSNATTASYDLTLDSEYYHNGKVNNLDEIQSFIKMDPGDYALVGSTEIANMPRDVAGRFGLSVSLFIQGIILSNGPQIDPGFRGRLYCLLFNTSSQQIQLKLGQHYATIEFLKLLEPTAPYKGKYMERNRLSDYLPRDIPSSAIGELRKDVTGLKREKWYIKILPLVVSIAALVVAIYKLIS